MLYDGELFPKKQEEEVKDDDENEENWSGIVSKYNINSLFRISKRDTIRITERFE